MMDDLHYSEYREEFYKGSHHLKKLVRELQTVDRDSDIYRLHSRINDTVDSLCELKRADMVKYKKHMKQILTDICERGL